MKHDKLDAWVSDWESDLDKASTLAADELKPVLRKVRKAYAARDLDSVGLCVAEFYEQLYAWEMLLNKPFRKPRYTLRPITDHNKKAWSSEMLLEEFEKRRNADPSKKDTTVYKEMSAMLHNGIASLYKAIKSRVMEARKARETEALLKREKGA